MKTNHKVIIILLGFLFLIALIIIVSFTGNDENKQEIERVITSHKGKVINIVKINGKQTPYNEDIVGNAYYKVTYSINDNKYIAWYRSTNTVGDIHRKSWRGLP
uniref:hypothetical protein n=1 Tax=Paenibacillus allorhizosphaerae TaxID=2849866 RepID=UPI001C401DD1